MVKPYLGYGLTLFLDVKSGLKYGLNLGLTRLRLGLGFNPGKGLGFNLFNVELKIRV